MLKKCIAAIKVMGMVVIGGLIVGGCAYHEKPQIMESMEPKATEWSSGIDCSGCHSVQVASMKDKNLLSNAHAEVEVTCLDCHEEEVMKTQHQAALAGTPGTKLKINKETCFNCHMDNPHTSYEEMAKLKDYINPHLNPHDSHVGRLQCRACHHMHKESQNKCSQCHMERTWPWKKVP